MSILVVYLKFVKTVKGKTLTHSGNHKYMAKQPEDCTEAFKKDKYGFKKAGWKLVEERIVKAIGR